MSELQTQTNGTPAAPTTPVTPPAGEPSEKMLSQSEVNKVVSARVNELNGKIAELKQQLAQRAESAAPAEEEKLTLKSLKAENEEFKNRMRFDKRLMKHGLDEDDADEIYDLGKLRGKLDDAEWIESQAKKRKTNAAGSSAATQPATTAPASQPQTPPASDRGSPAAPRTPIDEIDLLTASQADVSALVKTKGLKWVTDKFREQNKDRRFKL